MKSLLIGLTLCFGIAHADEVSVNVQNFNFTYKNPHGQGSAAAFSRTKKVKEKVEVSVDKIDKDFKLQVIGAETQEFVLKNAPGFMTEAETMNVSGFNLTLSEKLAFSLTSGSFKNVEDSLKLDGLNVDCNRDETKPEVMDQLISGCIQRMVFKTSKFSSQSVAASLSLVLSDAISKTLKGDLVINSMNIKTATGKYELTAEVKAQVSGKVKSNGSMSYDDKTGKISIKISEVKFSFFDITDKVFDELRKNESQKLKVKEPYVYYSIK